MLAIVPIILNLPEKGHTFTEHKYLKKIDLQLLDCEHHNPLEKNSYFTPWKSFKDKKLLHKIEQIIIFIKKKKLTENSIFSSVFL